MRQYNSQLVRIKYLLSRVFHLLINFKFFDILKKTYGYFIGSTKIDLDKLTVDKDLSLDDLFLKFGTDKGSLDGKKTYDYFEKNKKKNKQYNNYLEWINRKDLKNFEYQFGHDFTPFYEKYFGPIKDKPLRILEIGVANGHSIASWFNYFPNAEITAADMKKDYYFFYKAKRIKYETLDCMNDKQVENFLNRNEKFDIIIDDSDHTYDFFTNNIKKFYPAVKSGGIYVLEDFRNQDTLLGLAKRYNEAAGKRLLHNNHLLMDEMFNLIKNKKLFDHYILDKNTVKKIVDTIENIEIHYGDNPSSGIAFMFKK